MMRSYFIILCLIAGGILPGYSQKINESKIFNVFSDTLPVIGNRVIKQYKILIQRDSLILADSLKVNQKGFKVASFTLSAYGLGKFIEIHSNSNYFTEEMRWAIKNKNLKFKFIYLRNILVFNKFGEVIKPSLNAVKVSFID